MNGFIVYTLEMMRQATPYDTCSLCYHASSQVYGIPLRCRDQEAFRCNARRQELLDKLFVKLTTQVHDHVEVEWFLP